MADAQVRGASALGGVVTDPAWRAKPSWYLVATEDRMIPPPAQPAPFWDFEHKRQAIARPGKSASRTRMHSIRHHPASVRTQIRHFRRGATGHRSDQDVAHSSGNVRGGRDQRSSCCATGVSKRERPAEYFLPDPHRLHLCGALRTSRSAPGSAPAGKMERTERPDAVMFRLPAPETGRPGQAERAVVLLPVIMWGRRAPVRTPGSGGRRAPGGGRRLRAAGRVC
jgi:hypothetical protein